MASERNSLPSKENPAKRTTNVLFVGATTLWNKGTAAIVISAYEALRSFIPNANFASLSILPPHSDHFPKGLELVEDKIASGGGPFSVVFRSFYYVIWGLAARCLGLNLTALDRDVLEKYRKADIIIEVSGERLTDQFSLYSYIQYLLRIMLGIILGKDVVVYGESVGPFRMRISRILSKVILNKVKLITVRDRASLDHLIDVNISRPPVFFTADPAFLLEPAPYEEVHNSLTEDGIMMKSYKPNLVGVNASRAVIELNPSEFKGVEHKYHDIYVETISRLIDHLTSDLGSMVVLIPHGKISKQPGVGDDIATNREIFRKIKYKDRVKKIERDFSPKQIKAIIDQSDLFIGSRMHANIAAISAGVPTVAISYRYKFEEIMKSLGQDKYVWKFSKNSNFEELVSKVDEAYSKREEIRKELISKGKTIKRKSLENAILVKKLLDTLKEKKTKRYS